MRPSPRLRCRRSMRRSSCSRSSVRTLTSSSGSKRRALAVETLEGEADDGADLVVERGSLLNARLDPRTTARVGSSVQLAVDPARFHFFDPESGATLLPLQDAKRAELVRPVAG